MNSVDPQPQDDSLLKFIDYARSALSPEADEDPDPNGNGSETARPSWNWIVSRILKTCSAYSSGVTAAILLSDLSQVWVFSRIGFWFSVCVLVGDEMLGIWNDWDCV